MIQCSADPDSPACTYMGLAILCFFCFCGFLEDFATFGEKPKNLEKTKKHKKTTQVLPRPAPPCFFFFCFLFFFGFLEVFATFGQKNKKTKKHGGAGLGKTCFFFPFFFWGVSHLKTKKTSLI